MPLPETAPPNDATAENAPRNYRIAYRQFLLASTIAEGNTWPCLDRSRVGNPYFVTAIRLPARVKLSRGG